MLLGRDEGSVWVAAEWLNVWVMYRLCIGYVSVIVGSRLGIDPILSFMRLCVDTFTRCGRGGELREFSFTRLCVDTFTRC